MAALMTIVLFFFILLILYICASSAVVLSAWLLKRRATRSGAGRLSMAEIDETTDRLKNRWFIISIVLAFFVIAPFFVLLNFF